MDKCPFSGNPCPHRKCIHVTEVKDYEAVQEIHCCQKCGEGLLDPSSHQQKEPEAPQPQMNPQAMSLFEILKTLIQNKFSTIPSQVVLTNFTPTSFVPKPPCPTCGASLHDIAVAQRLGCPGCYDHYGKELLPVLVHAHKACEHVGKSPKNKAVTPEEAIKTLELKLKQAIEQEKYERAREIKTELDRLKNQ